AQTSLWLESYDRPGRPYVVETLDFVSSDPLQLEVLQGSFRSSAALVSVTPSRV
ncbi:hypothetical protein HAX54_051286, partial [Datura stramonium]|nr:hypothetical protein [Datura stramonium]